MRDAIDGIIIGAAAAAIGTIIAFKYINRKPIGGGQPLETDTYSYNAMGQRMTVVDPEPLPPGFAPMAQFGSPNTEAAYNQYPTDYAPAFGPLENTPGEQGETVLPI